MKNTKRNLIALSVEFASIAAALAMISSCQSQGGAKVPGKAEKKAAAVTLENTESPEVVTTSSHEQPAQEAKLEITDIAGATLQLDQSLHFADAREMMIRELVITATNTGADSAFDIIVEFDGSELGFKGGEYPGTGGTCAAVVDGHTSCTVVLEFMPSSGGDLTGAVQVTYQTAADPEGVIDLVWTSNSYALYETVEGYDHLCGLYEDGQVWCEGGNDQGQMGNGTVNADRNLPAQVPLAGFAFSITAGDNHSCAMLDDGQVQCWGSNSNGQVTGNAADGAVQATPVTVSSFYGAMSVYAGAESTCATLSGRVVSCL